MAGSGEEVLFPKVLVVPTGSAATMTSAPIGSLTMSGAKLWVATAAGVFQLVTSA